MISAVCPSTITAFSWVRAKAGLAQRTSTPASLKLIVGRGVARPAAVGVLLQHHAHHHPTPVGGDQRVDHRAVRQQVDHHLDAAPGAPDGLQHRPRTVIRLDEERAAPGLGRADVWARRSGPWRGGTVAEGGAGAGRQPASSSTAPSRASCQLARQ